MLPRKPASPGLEAPQDAALLSDAEGGLDANRQYRHGVKKSRLFWRLTGDLNLLRSTVHSPDLVCLVLRDPEQ